MASPAANPPFPRFPLFGAAGLIALSLTAAVIGRLQHLHAAPDSGSAVAERSLRFEDRADGAVTVYDTDQHRLVDVITGQNGFLRGTLRGLAQYRVRQGIGDDTPFRLTAWRDGRLTLDDPATGRHVELEAFGPTNEGVFARLLTLPEGPT
jgi:putative photosynthetic complex assembly protein